MTYLQDITETMDDARLLLIEGNHAEFPAFAALLRKKGFIVDEVSSGNAAKSRIRPDSLPELIIVNAATLKSNGKRICQSLKNTYPQIPILLILDEERAFEKVEADAILALPFTVQKLTNRIRNLRPGDGKECIQAGPFKLDMKKRTVTCAGKQAKLTPRLISLLKALIDQRGEVIERKALFSKVWETDYTEDTRTLDVHISWLRQAIEDDPDHPKILRTVRGVGYRLDA